MLEAWIHDSQAEAWLGEALDLELYEPQVDRKSDDLQVVGYVADEADGGKALVVYEGRYMMTTLTDQVWDSTRITDEELFVEFWPPPGEVRGLLP